ncbi:DUF4386 family protein, partial [Pseudarthrobacter sulfonivorans]|uniref:DUF4386 family protein n=1 Tax=Pseudarthrobacter sulfonivorans TaxID=121292 RepID=UPI00285D3A4F
MGHFLGMALLTGGLFVLLPALIGRPGLLAVTARFGALSAAIALALYGALQAVDGVALKHAVDAWAAAPEAEKSARFATAEGIRWLEWGMRSYQSFMLGTALLLFGIVVAATRRVNRVIGYLMGLSGVAYLVQRWIIGAYGFAAANTWPTLFGIVVTVAWTMWLLVSALRMKVSPSSTTGQAQPPDIKARRRAGPRGGRPAAAVGGKPGSALCVYPGGKTPQPQGLGGAGTP